MVKTKITKMWVHTYGEAMSIRVDWSDCRHHEIFIDHPHGKDNVIQALLDAAHLIAKDDNLI